MNPALYDFWRTPSRYKILYGGRASSKSWDAAANVIRISQTVKVRVLCARQFQNKIEESVYTLLVQTIERFGLQDKFKILASKIICKTTGSEFVFYGVARNIAEIKGLEGIDILWLEEAENIKKDDFGVLEATLRSEGSEIWIIFNPRFATDFIYSHFVAKPPTDGSVFVRKINYDENPFLSKTAKADIERLKKQDYDEYLHRYRGIPRSNDDRAIIKRAWLDSAIDAHTKLGIEPLGKNILGFDIADDGLDLNATALAKGPLCVSVDEWKGLEDELLRSCTRAYHQAVASNAEIRYDSIGVGATAGAKFAELNESRGLSVKYQKFNAGGAIVNPEAEYMPGVKNKDHFVNLKAQAWWYVADRLMLTHAAVVQGEPIEPDDLISISGDIAGLSSLLEELSTPLRDFTSSGRVKVESKEDLAKRQIKSPNKADAFIMAYAPMQMKPKFEWYVGGDS